MRGYDCSSSLFCKDALGPSYGDLTWLVVRLGNCVIGSWHCSKTNRIYQIVTPDRTKSIGSYDKGVDVASLYI